MTVWHGNFLKPIVVEELGVDGFMKAKVTKDCGMVELAVSGKTVKKPQIEIELPNGETTEWALNRTSYEDIAREYTPEIANWVGKEIVLRTVEQKIGKEMKNVIYAEAAQTE